jgi:preprotein translocase subunit YajC
LTDLTAWSAMLPILLAQAKKGAEGASGGGFFENPSFLIMMMVTFLLMYFLLMRPEQRKKKEAAELLASLKTNDHVVTIGGICGVVTNLSPSFVTIRVDDKSGAKIRVLRSAISRVGTPEEAEKEETKESK